MNNEEKNELVLKKVLIKKQEIIIKILKKGCVFFQNFSHKKLLLRTLKIHKKKIERETTFSKDNFKKAPNFSPTLPSNSF